MPVACLCATLMPGSARNHERAQRLNASPFAKEIKGKIEEFFIKASKGPDDDMANIFKNNKVEAATMRCRPNALGPKRLSTRDSPGTSPTAGAWSTPRSR
jgi:hypothetical protein